MHTVISGTDTPDRMSIFLKHEVAPHRQFCFVVECKRDETWYWSACACCHANVCVSGIELCRVDAVAAAEVAVDELDRCLNVYGDLTGKKSSGVSPAAQPVVR